MMQRNIIIYVGRIAKPVTRLDIDLLKNNGQENMVCYVAAMPCKQEYNLRREEEGKISASARP